MAELREYNPTWRDRIAAALMGDHPSYPRERLVSGLFGSTGLGTTKPGIVDLIPGVGSVLGAQEAIQQHDPNALAMSIMPGAPAAKAEMRALKAAAPNLQTTEGVVAALKPMIEKAEGKKIPINEYKSPTNVPINEGIKEIEMPERQLQAELSAYENAPSSKPWHMDPFGGVDFEPSIFTGIPRDIPFQPPPKAQAAGFTVPAVHGTRAPEVFSEFKLPEEIGNELPQLGVHFGSPKAAQHFAGNRLTPHEFMANSNSADATPTNWLPARKYPVVLQAQNPLELPDLGSWGAHRVARGLANSYPVQFPKEELEKIVPWMGHASEAAYIKATGNNPVDRNTQIQAMNSLRDLIRSKGYDSVKYKNEVEDPGHISHIILDPKQVRSPWAKFEDLNSRNLLAGLGGAAALTPEAQNMVDLLQKPKEGQ